MKKKNKHDIVIRLEKVVSKGGVKGYKVLSFKGVMGRDELPREYIEKTHFYRDSKWDETIFVRTDNNKQIDLAKTITDGHIFEIEVIGELLDVIRVGSKRLKVINDGIRAEKKKLNAKINKIKENWHGEIEIRL